MCLCSFSIEEEGLFLYSCTSLPFDELRGQILHRKKSSILLKVDCPGYLSFGPCREAGIWAWVCSKLLLVSLVVFVPASFCDSLLLPWGDLERFHVSTHPHPQPFTQSKHCFASSPPSYCLSPEDPWTVKREKSSFKFLVAVYNLCEHVTYNTFVHVCLFSSWRFCTEEKISKKHKRNDIR